MTDTRIERDSLGELKVPKDALWGAQTQRAVENFPISDRRMPRLMIRSLGLIKAAAARANAQLGLLDQAQAQAIVVAAEQVASGQVDEQFPVDIFQTGSGTSSNMNANEVIASLCAQRGVQVHPNDHVNMSQSSNDVIPTAIHLACALGCAEQLMPGVRRLIDTIEARAEELDEVAKTGRTHLMDAMPVTFGQELRAWSSQLDAGLDRLVDARKRLYALPQGGTAVGSGINAHHEFGSLFAEHVSALSGLTFSRALDHFAAQAALDTLVETSSHLRTLAITYTKIANDLRWMNSGPLAGLGEIELPTLQPGSSIMPGKVNPVVPEAVAMVAAQVIGNDATVAAAGQSGNFQLNVMLPVVASNLVESIEILAGAARVLADKAISGFSVREDQVAAALSRNPILVTALNREIGYDLGSKIAKEAYRSGRPVIEVAQELTDLSEARLRELLDPMTLTRGGLPGA